jgi:ribosomal protein S6
MNYYELTCLISPALSEQDVQEISQKIKDAIQEESGNLEKIILPVKKSLVHFVKKQEEAYLVIANFQLAPEKMKNLLKKLKSENQITRYMLLNKKPLKENSKGESRRRIPLSAEEAGDKKPAGGYGSVASRTKNKKVELKEIDKKIEEILNE